MSCVQSHPAGTDSPKQSGQPGDGEVMVLRSVFAPVTLVKIHNRCAREGREFRIQRRHGCGEDDSDHQSQHTRRYVLDQIGGKDVIDIV